MPPAAHVGRRGGALLLALISVLNAGSATAQDPGPAWERIGNDRPNDNDQYNVSFAPNGVLWSEHYYLDTLDVARTPREAWGRLAPVGFDGAPAFFVSANTFLVPGQFGVRRSTDRGRTIEILSRRFSKMYVPPAGSARPGRIHFASGNGTALAYSDDRGTTFVEAQWPQSDWAYSVWTWADMPGGAGPWGTGPSVRPGRMFARSSIYGLGISDDGGATWRQSSLWGFNIWVYHVTVLARPPEQGGGVRVVAMGEDTQAPVLGTQVWTSDDGGATFARTATLVDPSPSGDSWDVAALLPVVPGMASGTSNPVPSWTTSEALAVSTRGAVFRTTDGGLTWAQIPGPAGRVPLLPVSAGHSVWSAALGPDGRHYPATSLAGPDGTWPVRSTTNYAPVASEPPPAVAGAAVGPVVPNPASGRASLTLALPAAARVRVDLFDATGRLVRGGAETERAAGASSADVDLSGLAPGVYVARVTVTAAGGASSVSRRFVVAR